MKLPQPLLSFFAASVVRAPAIFKPAFHSFLRILGKPLTARFVDFVIDFEVAYRSDDWSCVERFFTDDAVYEVRNTSFDCRLVGPRQIAAGFKSSLDGFDRNLERSLRVVDGPHEEGQKVTFVWVGRYSLSDRPPLILSARQTAHYEGERIALLTDEYLPGYGKSADDWIEANAPDLSPAYE